MMGKYQPLCEYLTRYDNDRLKLSFEEVERIISDKLPPSASKYSEWWANGGYVQADAWLDAEWKVDKVELGEYVEFVK